MRISDWSSDVCSSDLHLAHRSRPRLQFSHEETILETGGGIKKALPLLGADPFFTVNAKIVWLNGKIDALARLAAAWDDAKMDARSEERRVGKDVAVRVVLGGRSIIKKKTTKQH